MYVYTPERNFSKGNLRGSAERLWPFLSLRALCKFRHLLCVQPYARQSRHSVKGKTFSSREKISGSCSCRYFSYLVSDIGVGIIFLDQSSQTLSLGVGSRFEKSSDFILNTQKSWLNTWNNLMVWPASYLVFSFHICFKLVH